MIKKKVLSLAVAGVLAGMTGMSNAAMSINPDGIGQIQLVPYFSTQNGNATLLNIVNTDTVNGKVVKVRFRGAVDSDDIFDFQLFLSPGDVWAGNISQAASGKSVMSTTDNSCTLPASINQEFVTVRLAGDTAQKAAGTREGYVEIITVADIDPASALHTATKHVNGVAPCTAATLGAIAANENVYLEPATTGLMANWTVINVPSTLVFSGETTAIVASAPVDPDLTADDATGVVTDVYYKQTNDVQAAAGLTQDAVLLNALTAVQPREYDFPDLSTVMDTAYANPQAQVDALETILNAANIINEYITDASISAATDWVVSMPTRRYAVAGRGDVYTTAAGDAVNGWAIESLDAANAGPTAPFGNGDATVNQLAAADALDATYFADDGRSACVVVQGLSNAGGTALNVYDRSERFPQSTTSIVISPQEPSVVGSYQLCGEVNVLTFNNGNPSGALGAELVVQDYTVDYADGWANYTLSKAGVSNAGGLPVIGYAAVKAVNPAVAAGVSGNFGGVWMHRK